MAQCAEDIERQDKIQAEREKRRSARRAEADCDGDDSEKDDSGEESDERDAAIDAMRQNNERKKDFKPKGPADVLGEEIQNLNAKKKKNIKMKDLNSTIPVELSRREREAIENEEKKAKWLERHKRGETDEAKKDLARLKMIRQRRAMNARRTKEEEDSASIKEVKKKVVVEEVEDTSETTYEDLTSREIKKMNPKRIKDELQQRGQSYQGSKKVLIKRLTDWCKKNQKKC